MHNAVDLIHATLKWLQKSSYNRIIVAYSGGCDSQVLLHALAQLRGTFSLSAVHVNHQLHPQAQSWVQHCQKICQILQVPLSVIPLNLTIQRGDSLEEVARKARYGAFAKLLQAGEILCTAHMREDQAETFLLQLLRGSGLPGLAGMGSEKPLGAGKLIRPFLTIDKKDLIAYAQFYDLQWVEDSSNSDVQFRRNFLRHHIFPHLKKVYPSAAKCIARSANHCWQAHLLLEEFINDALVTIQGCAVNILSISKLARYSTLKQTLILRQWIKKNGVICPNARKTQTILQQMQAAADAQPLICWAGAEIRRYRDELHIIPSSSQHELTPILWDPHAPLTLHNGAIWQAQQVLGQGIHCERLPSRLEVRFRQGGERCQVAGKPFSQPLKKLLQQYAIPTWQRAHLPLFYAHQQLVAVADLFICQAWQATPQQVGWVITRV